MNSLQGEILDDEPGSEVLKSSIILTAPTPHLPRRLENLSTLKVLDISRTNIQSLPPSISTLSLLTVLILQECSMLMELPPEIGKLKNLMMFDLEGTEIICLPKEMGKLENLQCLRVSFCSYADEYKDSKGIENIIPRTIMSKFSKLEELSLFVNPDAKWWEVEVIEAIAKNLRFLPRLQTLKLYLPTVKALRYFLQLENCQVPIYSTLRDFRLKIGHSEQLTTCLNTRLVESFEKLEKCLKYENGEGSTDDIKELIRHAKSLFVCRHWTIKNLSIFDISSLKYCLLAECNEIHTIVDADEFYDKESNDNDGKDAFASLEYLAIHSMKNLQSIWKGPIARNSLSCLQVLALHTCLDLTTVFTEGMLDNLNNLAVVIVEDCPKVTSLVSRGSTHGIYGSFLPNLRKILLLDLPELVCLSNGVCIAPRLDNLLVFNCLKLDYLSQDELSRDVKEIKGETEWWDALKSRDLAYSRAFVPLKRDGYLMNQLAQDTNSLKEFDKLRGRGEAVSGSTQLSSYETKKHLDWGMFVKYLKNRKPPVPLAQCNPGHVIEFLNYQSKFGDVRVHIQSCLLYGHPNPIAACFCPFREAWGTLEAIATRLHDAYEENRLPDMEPFDSGYIQSYLNEVRKSQQNALGITSKSPVNSSLRNEDSGAGTMNDEKQGFRLPGAVTETGKLIDALQEIISSGPGSSSRGRRTTASTRLPDPTLLAIHIITTQCSTVDWKNYAFETRLIEIYQYLVATGNIQSWLNSAAAYSEHLSLMKDAIRLAMSWLMDEFRAILKLKIKSREHSLSVNPVSTTSPGTSAHGSSTSTHEVQDDHYAEIYTVSPELIIFLRIIAVWARSKGCIQPFVDIYIHERKTIMQSRSLPFNFKIWSTYEIKNFEWGVLEPLIEVWIKSVKTSFKSVFDREKQLCEKIFQGPETDIEDICFEVIIQDYQIQVFNIIYTLSFSNPPPDKIFIILDLYETLDHFLNEISFFGKRREPFKVTVGAQLLKMLSDKIISFLSIFEMVLLYHESSVILVGPVDPLPRYVMSYLYQLCDHKHALKKLSLPNLPSIDEDNLSLYSEELKGQSELSRHVIWIIMMTVSNLEGKAKLCTDASSGQFFAMKNIHYIAHKIQGHQALMEVVGDDYFGKLILKFDQAKVKYVMLSLRSEMIDYGAE